MFKKGDKLKLSSKSLTLKHSINDHINQIFIVLDNSTNDDSDSVFVLWPDGTRAFNYIWRFELVPKRKLRRKKRADIASAL